MIIKTFDPKDRAPWGFNVHFECDYGQGQAELENLLGNRKDAGGEWRWFLLQDLPRNMVQNKSEKMKNGWFIAGTRKKGRIYVFTPECSVLLRLLAN